MNDDDDTTLTSMGRFRVYRMALRIAKLVNALPLAADLREQTNRAAASIVLNIAEASSQVSAAMAAKHYGIARGSLRETAGGVDLARMRLGERVEFADIRENARALDAMLGRLAERR